MISRADKNFCFVLATGLAVGLAAKEVVSNFFGGAVIFLTRPFVIGESIKVKKLMTGSLFLFSCVVDSTSSQDYRTLSVCCVPTLVMLARSKQVCILKTASFIVWVNGGTGRSNFWASGRHWVHADESSRFRWHTPFSSQSVFHQPGTFMCYEMCLA
jgi:hypothetical protein